MEKDNPLFVADLVTSNEYTSVIDNKYLTQARHLIDNGYPVSTDDPAVLAEFLRKKDAELKEQSTQEDLMHE